MVETSWPGDGHHRLSVENAVLTLSWHAFSRQKDILTFLMWYESIWISSREIQPTYVFYVTLL